MTLKVLGSSCPLLAAWRFWSAGRRAPSSPAYGRATPITTSDGNFRDCTMTAQAKSGVLLGFVISSDYGWGLVLADDQRNFELGRRGGRDARRRSRPDHGIAKVVDVHGIVIPLENTDPVVDALREGKVLTIVAEGSKISFKLTGTKDAIAALAACVTEHLGTEKV